MCLGELELLPMEVSQEEKISSSLQT